VQFLLASKPLRASIVVASFGSAAGLNTVVFDVVVSRDPNAPAPKYTAPERYGKLPEIHHIFRAEPRNPPKVVSLFFAAAVAATVPALFIGVSS
jgi:oligosaccharyltransferase complex subunit delta (ribophorin II)